jgi:protein-L-isoaspartate(D-aspartate) O-methyltransferase
VLEIGTGSGYQAAILSRLVPKGRVLTLERIPNLADTARAFLQGLGCTNVAVRLAGRTLGAQEDGPFDAILVTAAAPRLPQTLLDQLAPGGRIVAPVGSLREQELVKAVRTDEGLSYKMLGPCRFVPLIGEGAWSEGELGLP